MPRAPPAAAFACIAERAQGMPIRVRRLDAAAVFLIAEGVSGFIRATIYTVRDHRCAPPLNRQF
jgi:hypothetical protein